MLLSVAFVVVFVDFVLTLKGNTGFITYVCFLNAVHCAPTVPVEDGDTNTISECHGIKDPQKSKSCSPSLVWVRFWSGTAFISVPVCRL